MVSTKRLLAILSMTALAFLSLRIASGGEAAQGSGFVYSAPLPPPLPPNPKPSRASIPPPLPAPGESLDKESFSTAIVIGEDGGLIKVLTDAGAARDEATAAAKAFDQVHDRQDIKEGHEIVVNFTPRSGLNPSMGIPGRFEGFSFIPEHSSLIAVSRDGNDGFKASKAGQNLKRSLIRTTFVIENGLLDGAAKAGLPARGRAELFRIFSWDIDFQRDVRRGGRFDVMFERFNGNDGKLIHEGRILYASLRLKDKSWSIYYHADREGIGGYFRNNGESASKALLRTPLDGARISSGFGKRRHPILGYLKQHRGIDFAAAPGTPIFAAGDGLVEAAGVNGPLGKYVRIRHGQDYATAYGHLSRINAKAGKRVRQGQVIGFAGNTGLSTGRHLHYEILKGQERVNPLTVSMPPKRALTGEELRRFKETMTIIDYQLAYLAEDAGENQAQAVSLAAMAP